MRRSKGISLSWALSKITFSLENYKHTGFSWIKRERKGNSTIKDIWLTLFLSESNLFKYAVNLFLNLDDSAQLRGALFQNSLTCCVRDFCTIPLPEHHRSTTVTEFFHSPRSNHCATVRGWPRATAVTQQLARALMNQSGLYKCLLEKVKICSPRPSSVVSGDRKGHTPQMASWAQDPALDGRLLVTVCPCGPCLLAGPLQLCYQPCCKKNPSRILGPWLLRDYGYMAPWEKASFFSLEAAAALQEVAMTAQTVLWGLGTEGSRTVSQAWFSLMGLEPEGDSTAVWRHLPVDTEKEMFVIKRIKCNVTFNTQDITEWT